MRRILTRAALGILILTSGLWLMAGEPNETERRDRAGKAAAAGNFKNAYEDLRKLLLDAKSDPRKVGDDLHLAVQCLQRLGRANEIDDMREAAITTHAKNWRFLTEAAKSYIENSTEHYGFIVAGKFERGGHRGG